MYKLVSNNNFANSCSNAFVLCPSSCAALIPKAAHNNPIATIRPAMSTEEISCCKLPRNRYNKTNCKGTVNQIIISYNLFSFANCSSTTSKFLGSGAINNSKIGIKKNTYKRGTQHKMPVLLKAR